MRAPFGMGWGWYWFVLVPLVYAAWRAGVWMGMW